MSEGIQYAYFSRELPDRAVAIARVSSSLLTAAQLTDVDNQAYNQGQRGVWLSTSDLSLAPDSPQVNGAYVEAELGKSFAITGATDYRVANQFFELTYQVASDGTPLYYRHPIGPGVAANPPRPVIVDLNGAPVAAPTIVVLESDGLYWLYHDLADAAYQVRYTGRLGTESHLLHCDPVLAPRRYAPDANGYVYFGRVLQLAVSGSIFMRFTADNGYQVLPPHNGLPNTPWYARIRFATVPWAPEWARQLWLPQRPYMLGVWIPGRVLDPHVMEFERKPMLLDANHLPDILVFDREHAIKYALEGTHQEPGLPRRRGNQYPWRRGMVQASDVDAYQARVEVKLELAADDIVYGFYSYLEPDVIYRDLDVNPFTNPAVRDKIVYFYLDLAASDPQRLVQHRVCEENDPIPYQGEEPGEADLGLSGWAQVVINDVLQPSYQRFGSLMVGASVGASSFSWTDARHPGGGLKPKLEASVPESSSFFDIGYIDGKPYPVAGGLVVNLPTRILETMSATEIEAKIREVLPLGTVPVIFYYDSAGEDYR